MRMNRQVVLACAGIAAVMLAGTIGYGLMEKMSWFDALWMTVITVLTVGYGDKVPITAAGKIYTMILIPIGIGVVTYALGAVAAVMLEGKLSGTFRRRRMDKDIGRLSGHIIICGLGRVGQQVMEQLRKEHRHIVVVDTAAAAKLDKLNEHQQILYVEGDATEDEVLYRAGINRAQGLVATLPQDAENVYVTLSAKGINPKLQVVARAERPESEEKLRRAGADKVINPSSIGGRRMAMSILKPISVDYVDTVLHDRHEDFGVEELLLEAGSPLSGKSLQESRVRELYGVTVVAIRQNGVIIHNPKPDEIMPPGAHLIVFGSYGQLVEFGRICRGPSMSK